MPQMPVKVLPAGGGGPVQRGKTAILSVTRSRSVAQSRPRALHACSMTRPISGVVPKPQVKGTRSGVR